MLNQFGEKSVPPQVRYWSNGDELREAVLEVLIWKWDEVMAFICILGPKFFLWVLKIMCVVGHYSWHDHSWVNSFIWQFPFDCVLNVAFFTFVSVYFDLQVLRKTNGFVLKERVANYFFVVFAIFSFFVHWVFNVSIFVVSFFPLVGDSFFVFGLIFGFCKVFTGIFGAGDLVTDLISSTSQQIVIIALLPQRWAFIKFRIHERELRNPDQTQHWQVCETCHFHMFESYIRQKGKGSLRVKCLLISVSRSEQRATV